MAHPVDHSDLHRQIEDLKSANREFRQIAAALDADLRNALTDFEAARKALARLRPEAIAERFERIDLRFEEDGERMVGIERKAEGQSETLYGGKDRPGIVHGVRLLLYLVGAVLVGVVGQIVVGLFK